MEQSGEKKIFFLLYSMNLGGVEKSFTSLLSEIKHLPYDIHVGLVFPRGELLSLLPSNITIHTISDLSEHWKELKNPPLVTIKNYFTTGHIFNAIIACFIYLCCKVWGSNYLWIQYILRNAKGLKESFDVAIAYAGPTADLDYYLCKKIKANVKCGWVHFDISKFGTDKGMTKQLYKLYNRIFIVSETGKEIFDKTFPQFSNKTEVFHNIVSPSQIRDMAKIGESYKDDFSGKRILTLGRISPEKGQVIAIRAFAILVKKVPNLRWYFIGHGIDLDNCKKEAKDLGVEDKVVFLGLKTNPYAYIRDCDIFVQPSRHEGYCISLCEALCFGNPIVATDFTGAREQLKNRENGFVVGMDTESIAKGIEQALLSQKTNEVSDLEENDIHKLLDLIS